jgi:hypothetical protein
MHTARHTGGLTGFAAIFLVSLLASGPVRAEPGQTQKPPNACLQAHTDAQVLRKDGQLIKAREQLLRCAQSDCPSVVIDDCAGWLPSLENSIPTAVFAVTDQAGHDIVEAKVLNQGQVLAERANGRAVPLDPGLYTIEIIADGYVKVSERFVMRESEKNRIVRVTMQPTAADPLLSAAEPPADVGGLKPIPMASWILGGAALGSGIVFGVSGALYLAAKSDIEAKRCDAGDAVCERERRDIADRGKTYTTIDRIAGPVAAASLLAAIIVYVVSDGPAEKASASRLHFHASAVPGAAEVQLSGHF